MATPSAASEAAAAAEASAVVALWLQLLIGAVWAAFLVRGYSRKDVHIHYKLVVWLGWFLGFAGTLVLPTDMASSAVATQGVAALHLSAFWSLLYWVTMLLAWVYMPILQVFHISGQFDWRGKLRNAIRVNLKYYACMIIALVAFIIYLVAAAPANVRSHGLYGFLIALGNGVGLLMVVVLLGHGLVAVPRDLWARAKPEDQLRKLYFRAAALDSDVFDARCKLDDTVKEVQLMAAQVNNDPTLSVGDNAVKRAMDVVLQLCPESSGAEGSSDRTVSASRTSKHDRVKLKAVESLHARLKLAILGKQQVEAMWERLLREVSLLQDLVNRTSEPTAGFRERRCSALKRKFWQLRVRFGTQVMRGLSVLCAIFSVIVLWSELVVPFAPQLSLVALIVGKTGESSFLRVEIMSVLLLAYMALCTYTGLFSLKVSSLYELHWRQTSPYSLLYNASYLCRMQFSLEYNFHTLTRFTNSAFAAAFSKSMSVTALGATFSVWAPITLLLFAGLAFFRVYRRVMRFIGLDSLRDPTMNAEDNDAVADGKNLIARAEAKRKRKQARSISPRRGLRASAKADEDITRTLLTDSSV